MPAAKTLQLPRIDKACAVGNLFRAGYFQPLPLLDDLNERTGFQQ